jgi:hypothetical protein
MSLGGRLTTVSRRLSHSRLSGLQRFHSTASASSGSRLQTLQTASRARNAAFITLVLSTSGISAFLYETYFSAKVHADSSNSQLNPRSSAKSRQTREILHAQKKDTLHGVDVEHILTRCEETVLESGPGVWRYDINQIARYDSTEVHG